MRILCDRCKKEMVSFDNRDNWTHIETSEKVDGKSGDYYLCPECSKNYMIFSIIRQVRRNG